MLSPQEKKKIAETIKETLGYFNIRQDINAVYLLDLLMKIDKDNQTIISKLRSIEIDLDNIKKRIG